MILVGGGNVGLALGKRLIANGEEILLLEKDPVQAQRLASLLGEGNVAVGDGCEMSVQKEIGFGRADVVIAVTGEDEDNLVVCQMAKEVWHVERVLARVNEPDHESIFHRVGVDETVSATGIIYSLLEQQIQTDTMMPVGALGRGNIEVVEVRLGSRSPAVHKRVRDLMLPPQTNIAWALRGDQGLTVDGDTELLPGDVIVALIPRERANELRDLLAATKA